MAADAAVAEVEIVAAIAAGTEATAEIVGS
jgi:hypothetical protein